MTVDEREQREREEEEAIKRKAEQAVKRREETHQLVADEVGGRWARAPCASSGVSLLTLAGG